MDFNSIMNGGLMYTLVIIGLAVVIVMCVITLRKAWRRALEMGISKEKIMVVVRSSALFSIVPSISIVIGVFTLSAVLGIPWSWYRLSVIGSLNYELTSAGVIATSAGFESLGEMAGQGDTSLIGAIMFTMSFCIMPGLILLVVAGKKIQTSLVKLSSSRPETGALLLSCCLLALVVVFFPSMVLGNTVKRLTFLTSAAIGAIFLLIMKKFKIGWLQNFTLAATLILSMVCSVFYTNIFS